MKTAPESTLTEIEHRSASEFDAWAKHFDAGLWGAYFRAANRRMAREVARLAPNASRILDVGCGIGGLLLELRARRLGRQHLGLDLSSGMLTVARTRLGQGTTLVARGTAQALPVGECAVDVVCCMNAFHHFPDQAEALREIGRVLRPGGVFVLLDPSTDGFARSTWTRLLDRICDEEGLATYRGRDELANMLRGAGLQPESTEHYLHVIAITVARKPAHS